MKKIPFILVITFAISFYPSCSQNLKVQKNISVMLDQYALALNAKDAKRAASNFLSDSFFRYISDGFIVSKEDWINYKSESLNRMDYYSFRWTKKEIKLLSHKSAVATCESYSTYQIKGGPKGPLSSVYTLTFEKINHQWFITGIHESHDNTEQEKN
jgi:hypothetical protein